MPPTSDEPAENPTADIATSTPAPVIAEGVEDDATSQALIELGCDVAQGWKYSKAIPADEWPQWLEKAPVASLSE